MKYDQKKSSTKSHASETDRRTSGSSRHNRSKDRSVNTAKKCGPEFGRADGRVSSDARGARQAYYNRKGKREMEEHAQAEEDVRIVQEMEKLEDENASLKATLAIVKQDQLAERELSLQKERSKVEVENTAVGHVKITRPVDFHRAGVNQTFGSQEVMTEVTMTNGNIVVSQLQVIPGQEPLPQLTAQQTAPKIKSWPRGSVKHMAAQLEKTITKMTTIKPVAATTTKAELEKQRIMKLELLWKETSALERIEYGFAERMPEMEMTKKIQVGIAATAPLWAPRFAKILKEVVISAISSRSWLDTASSWVSTNIVPWILYSMGIESLSTFKRPLEMTWKLCLTGSVLWAMVKCLENMRTVEHFYSILSSDKQYPAEKDLRPDAITLQDIKHEDPLIAPAKYIKMTSFKLGSKRFWSSSEETIMTGGVSKELFSQITTSRNIGPGLKKDAVCMRLQQHANNFNTINLNRYDALKKHTTVQNTILFAYGKYMSDNEETFKKVPFIHPL